MTQQQTPIAQIERQLQSAMRMHYVVRETWPTLRRCVWINRGMALVGVIIGTNAIAAVDWQFVRVVDWVLFVAGALNLAQAAWLLYKWEHRLHQWRNDALMLPEVIRSMQYVRARMMQCPMLGPFGASATLCPRCENDSQRCPFVGLSQQ